MRGNVLAKEFQAILFDVVLYLFDVRYLFAITYLSF